MIITALPATTLCASVHGVLAVCSERGQSFFNPCEVGLMGWPKPRFDAHDGLVVRSLGTAGGAVPEYHAAKGHVHQIAANIVLSMQRLHEPGICKELVIGC